MLYRETNDCQKRDEAVFFFEEHDISAAAARQHSAGSMWRIGFFN